MPYQTLGHSRKKKEKAKKKMGLRGKLSFAFAEPLLTGRLLVVKLVANEDRRDQDK